MEFFNVLLATLLTLVGGFVTTTTPEVVPAMQTAQVVAVLDGDTIVVAMDGKEEFVRYIGIDTPEKEKSDSVGECFSAQATEANKARVANKEVQLVQDIDNRDTYNRLLRYVYVDDVFVNAELVEDGFATTLTIPPNIEHKVLLSDLESQAQVAKRGLWSECQGLD